MPSVRQSTVVMARWVAEALGHVGAVVFCVTFSPLSAVQPIPAASRQLMSGNEAVARAAWEAGVRVAAAYPGTPSTEILEALAGYPDLYAEWSVNEKVSLEITIGASMMGSRAICAMKHVGLNVASDALMTLTLTGTVGGLVIVIADDVGMSSSQNEQDSRHWGRFAHVPILEPADAQEAHAMTKLAFEISEEFETPVLVRLTSRICHVKGVVATGERIAHEPAGFTKDPQRWVMVPVHARQRIPVMFEREEKLRAAAVASDLNLVDDGADRTLGFVTGGPDSQARLQLPIAAREDQGLCRVGRDPGGGRRERAADGTRTARRRGAVGG